MTEYTVLICDDNIAIHNSLTSYLKSENIEVISTYDGNSALSTLRLRHIDVLVLDVMLPGMDGYEVCREVHKIDSNIYIIMLSAKGTETDRIVGLEVGADDYVVKPFSPREVVIKIKKALKRKYQMNEPKKLVLAELTVLPESYRVFVGNKEIILTAKEIDVLAFLVSKAGMVLTREHILNAVWGYEYYGDTRVVDSMIKRIRQKVVLENAHFAIKTIYGIGYKIEATS